MDTKEIIAKWNQEHPTNAILADDAQQLLQMLADGDAENASALATEIAKRQAEEIVARKANEIKRCEHILDNFDKNDSFLEDHSIGEICSLAMQADGKAAEYISSVLNSWRSPFQQALGTYREAIEKLCNRWCFGNVAEMLSFIFTNSESIADFDMDACTFLQGEDGECSSVVTAVDWKLRKCEDDLVADFEEMVRRLANVLADDGITTNENNQFVKDGKELDHPWADVLEAADIANDFDEGALICYAVYICFHPDIIKRLSDAEILLRILYCFLNGATNNDQAVRYGLLRTRIEKLKKELPGK